MATRHIVENTEALEEVGRFKVIQRVPILFGGLVCHNDQKNEWLHNTPPTNKKYE